MPQAPETVTALRNRLNPVLDDSNVAVVEAARAHWPTGAGFGDEFDDVQAIIMHATAGWPFRSKADIFVQRITGGPGTAKRGFSGQYYMSYDGAAFQVFAENKIIWHANQENRRAIGIETGCLANVAAPTSTNGPWNRRWQALSTDAEDIPGAKLYIRRAVNDIVVAFWTVSRPSAPDSVAAGSRMMLFSDAQYRSLALLGRYLAERWKVPRKFPLRPHLLRSRNWRADNSEIYRALVDADPMKDILIRTQLTAAPIICPAATYATEAGLRAAYRRGIYTASWTSGGTVKSHRVNRLWTRFFSSYRGFHGHGFSGAVRGNDHNCPGATFEWHRFAREVWDWWWFPFDLAPVLATNYVSSVQQRRDYGRTAPDLLEYYFDPLPSLYYKKTTRGFFGVGEEVARPVSYGSGGVAWDSDRYWGYWHGGMHFQLSADTPVYAAANGQVVAARFPSNLPSGARESTRFLLVRHEVFHHTTAEGRINYNDQEPSIVYSLYMHLGQPEGMSFDNVVDANPDWLNKILKRKKEYDLGLAFHNTHPHAAWGDLPAGWRQAQTDYDQILSDLRAGRTVVFPEIDNTLRSAPNPQGTGAPFSCAGRALHVTLGDFLGTVGEFAGGYAIHFEIFSRDLIDGDHFTGEQVNPSGPFYDQSVTERVTRLIQQRGQVTSVRAFRNLQFEQRAARLRCVALRFKSEWALQENDFPQGGWTRNQPLMWWRDVIPAMNRSAPDVASLPADGVVWHYHPLGFMAWLNRITWRSEWPKYRITNSANAPVPCPARPPLRQPLRFFLPATPVPSGGGVIV